MPEQEPSAAIRTPSGIPRPLDGLQTESPPFPVPDHTLIRRIGKGAYGEVWLARNALGTWRAVKFVRRSSFDDDKPFEREFAGIQRFEPISRSHESQLNILHVGRAEDGFYYVMELADDMNGAQASGGTSAASKLDSRHPLTPTGGEDVRRTGEGESEPLSATVVGLNPDTYTPRNLRSELHLRGRLPLDECLRLGVALTTALAHLHRHGLVHRDIKPSNLVFIGGQPKLADIGLVTGIDEAKSFVGTEGYIPPEGPGTPSADLYSLGKVLYEISTGKRRQEFPELPEDFRGTAEGETFSDFNEILLRACASESGKRYATAEEMRAELLLLQSGRSIRGLRANERLVRRLKLSGVIGTTCLVIVAAAALFQRQRAVERAEQVQARRQTAFAADMAIAFQSWEVGRADLTRQLLEAQRPAGEEEDLRGWEWRYLWGQSLQNEARRMTVASPYGLWSCAFSTDGQIVAGGTSDGQIVGWNPHAGQIVRELGQPGPINPVDSLAFTRDGSFLFQALRYTGEVVVWDWANEQERFRFGTTNKGLKFALSPDETLVATGDGTDYAPTGSGEFVLWDAHSGREVARAPPQPTWLIRVTFSPKGGHLATSGGRGHARIWSVPDLREVAVLPHEDRHNVFAIAFSPDGRRLVTGTSDGVLRMWEWESRRLVATWLGHAFGCDAVQWSPDGKLLATGGRDQIVRLWNPTNQMELAAFRGHAGRVTGLAFSPDGQLLVSSSEDKTLRSWNVAAARPDPPRQWRASNQDPELALSPDSRWLALHGESNAVELLSFSGLENVASVAGARPAFSPDSHWLVTLVSNRLHKFSVPEGRLQRTFEADGSLAGTPAFSPDGTRLAMGTTVGSILIWDLTNSAPSLRVAGTNRLEGLFFAADRSEVVALHAVDGTLEWFDSLTGNRTRRLATGEGSVTAAALSPDGQSVLIGETAPRMRLVNLTTGRMELLPSDMGSVISVAWSADGQTLAAGTFDGFIKLWNARTRREMATLRGHISLVTALEFSRDGRHLVSGSFDNTWRLWSAPVIGETEAVAKGP